MRSNGAGRIALDWIIWNGITDTSIYKRGLRDDETSVYLRVDQIREVDLIDKFTFIVHLWVFSSFQEEWAYTMARRPSSVCLSVCPSVCKLLRKSLLLAGKWPDRHQTFTRWTPDQLASRVCSRSRSRSKVTWYAHFLGLGWATPSLAVWLWWP